MTSFIVLVFSKASGFFDKRSWRVGMMTLKLNAVPYTRQVLNCMNNKMSKSLCLKASLEEMHSLQGVL